MQARPVRSSLALIVAALLSGCVGLSVPITRKMPHPDDATDLELYRYNYDNPRRLAIYRIAQWSDASESIQRANGISIVGQSALSGAVTYRAARDLSNPATALLAATGLYGNSLSDAFVQVSRLNVYSAGIEGMECALAAYGTLPAPWDTEQYREDAKLLSSEGLELAREIAIVQARAEHSLDSAMLLAVSRITRKVDSALMGSLVTAASQGATWNSAYAAGTSAKPTPAQQNMFMARGTDTPDKIEARARLQALLERSLAYETEVLGRQSRLNACDITAPAATVERSGQPLAIDLLGESDPVKIKAGARATVRLHGGTPPYAPTVIGPNTAKIAVTMGDGGFVTIEVPTGTPAGDHRIALTDSTPGNSAKVLAVSVVP